MSTFWVVIVIGVVVGLIVTFLYKIRTVEDPEYPTWPEEIDDLSEELDQLFGNEDDKDEVNVR